MEKKLEKRILYNEVDDLAALEASLKVRAQYEKKGILIDLLPSEKDTKDISLGSVRDLIAKNSGTTEYVDAAIDLLYPSVQKKLSLVSEQNAKPSGKAVAQTYEKTLEKVFSEFPDIKIERHGDIYDIINVWKTPKKQEDKSFFEYCRKLMSKRFLLTEFDIFSSEINIYFHDPTFLNLCSEQLLDLESRFSKHYKFGKQYYFPIETWEQD